MVPTAAEAVTSPPTVADGVSYLPADRSVDLVDLTVGGLLALRAAELPDRPALVGARHGDGREVRLTYAELHAEARRVATALLRLARPGDHVALWAPSVVEWPVVQYGAAIAGVRLVALNPVLRDRELEYALRHSGSAVLLHADRSRDYDMAAVAGRMAELFPGLTVVSLRERDRWRADEADEALLAASPTDPDLPVMLQYTSGTTGNPKGVLLRHRSLVNVARLTMEHVGAPAQAKVVSPLPMFHTAGCVVSVLGPLWSGGVVRIIEQFVPSVVLDHLRADEPDVLLFVPAILGALLEAQRAATEPAPRLPLVMGGASNLPASMIEAAERVFGASVLNIFGQTELAPVLSATRPDDDRQDQLTTVGHPLPQVEVKVVDPVTGAVVPAGERGEICARGYQQLVEYLHDPAATAAAVDGEGFVHTGDLGSMDARGYLTVTGRLKDLIIRGGENIAPAEIESVLVTHPDVLEAAVLGLPDERLGEQVGAVVRLRDEREGLLESLRTHARDHLSPHKVPARWFVAEALPVTPTGKVQKFRLADQLRAGGIDGLRELVG